MQKYKAGELRTCEICGVTNKDKQVSWYNKFNKTLCSKHASQLYYKGAIQSITHYDINEYVLYDDYAEIILRDRDYKEICRTTIDISDVEKCKAYKWFLKKAKPPYLGYVVAKDRATRKEVYLHRFILDYQGELQVDHINRDVLNNRRQNLRVATISENNSNRSFTNITSYNNKYMARLTRDRQKYYFGCFETKEEAEDTLNAARRTYEENKELFHQTYKKYKVGA